MERHHFIRAFLPSAHQKTWGLSLLVAELQGPFKIVSSSNPSKYKSRVCAGFMVKNKKPIPIGNNILINIGH